MMSGLTFTPLNLWGLRKGVWTDSPQTSGCPWSRGQMECKEPVSWPGMGQASHPHEGSGPCNFPTFSPSRYELRRLVSAKPAQC